MAKAKKAAKRKAPVKKNLTPELECPVIVDFRTPQGAESSGRMATAVATFTGLFVAWVVSVRKYFTGGGKENGVPQFDEKNFFDANKGAQTQKQYDKDVDRYNAGEKVFFAPRYNPVLVDACHAMNAITLRRGLVSKHPDPPKDWDEKLYGSWYLLDEKGKNTIPSGWFFDEEKPRRCHSHTAERMIIDPAVNILTFGNYRYAVGDGTAVRCAAMLVWATSRGNYRAGDSARKRMSIAGNKDIVDVIFRIEDKPNNGGGYTVKGNWGDIAEVVFMPGQVLTAGFLFDAKGNRLTAKGIRGLDAKTTGLKFKTVRQVMDSPIVAKAISRERLWAEIQTIEGSKGIKKLREREGRGDVEVKTTPQNKTILNLKVTTRVAPNEAFPFAFRAAQCDMVPYTINESDGEFSMGVVIGDRSNFDYNVGVNEAKAEEAVEETLAPKKVTRRKPADAAPPVEGDNTDEVETVKETVEA